jgi:hypothetical protein
VIPCLLLLAGAGHASGAGLPRGAARGELLASGGGEGISPAPLPRDPGGQAWIMEAGEQSGISELGEGPIQHTGGHEVQAADAPFSQRRGHLHRCHHERALGREGGDSPQYLTVKRAERHGGMRHTLSIGRHMATNDQPVGWAPQATKIALQDLREVWHGPPGHHRDMKGACHPHFPIFRAVMV